VTATPTRQTPSAMKKNIARPRRVIRIKHFSYCLCLSDCDEVQLF
jgi:hypothetical protein